MNRILMLLLFVLLADIVNGQIVNQPAFDFTRTGLYNVKRVQLGDTSTIVDLHITFMPGWWTRFGKDVYLENDTTGERYMIKGIKGIDFDHKIITPNSGDTLVTLVFPHLDKNIKKLNFGEGNKALIFGISLTETASVKKTQGIPNSVQKWLDSQTSQEIVKSSQSNYDLEFFKNDSIKVVGYIKGYDKRAGFSSGIIYQANNLTREDHPTTIQVYDDGRFEVQFPAFHPMRTALLINAQRIPFYAEPGNTVGIILDWRDFLAMDRYRNRSKEFEYIRYFGDNQMINSQLSGFKLERPDYSLLEKLQKTVRPDEFKKAQMGKWFVERKRLDSILMRQNLLSKTQIILKNELDLLFANYLFDYESDRGYFAKQDTSNAILKAVTPRDYFDFIKHIDLNNKSLLINGAFSLFINCFEYSPLFLYAMGGGKDYYAALDSFSRVEYKTKEIPLIINVAKLRTFNYKIENSTSDSDVQLSLVSLKSNMRLPFLKGEADRLVKLYKKKKFSYQLPNTAGAKVFKKIIDKYKGKILIVDFWAQWCGPCIGGIERSLATRKKFKDNPNFDFVFITDVSGTPDIAFFDKFNEKNFMVNSYRITADEYLLLRELFKFNGIPRYVLVDEKGGIRNDKFENYNFSSEMVKHFPEKFKNDYFK